MALEVLDPGPLTLVQDLGRPGREQWGVAPTGAFDRASHALAQRLVGNEPGAAGLEVLLGGLRLVAAGDVVVAVAGAPVPLTAAGRPEGPGLALRLRPGEELALGRPAAGVRTYLAVRGGLAVPAVLGSRSRDTGSGLGPVPLAAGDVLPVGAAVTEGAGSGRCPRPRPRSQRPGRRRRWRRGRTTTWRAIRRAAGRSPPTATGSACGWWAGRRCRRVPGSLPSFPVLPGSVQATPAGELLVLGPDAGVTGGYPVVGLVTGSSLDRLAQCRPGDVVAVRRRTRRSPGRGTGAPSARRAGYGSGEGHQ